MTLQELHGVIQIAMSWENYHLHCFDVDGVLYGDLEDVQSRWLGDEKTFTVGQAAEAARAFSYEYDFGDSWEHEIRVEQVVDSIGACTPRVSDGARACPPEDCGGVPGYEELLAAVADPTHEQHAELLEWSGGELDHSSCSTSGR